MAKPMSLKTFINVDYTQTGDPQQAYNAKKRKRDIGAGTDAGIPMVYHHDFIHELILLHEEQGFSPMEAIQCATINNAKIMGKSEEIGSLAPNKFADFPAAELLSQHLERSNKL